MGCGAPGREAPCSKCGSWTLIGPSGEAARGAGTNDGCRPRLRPQTDRSSSADQASSASPARRWVGNTEVAGRPISRILDAACYLIAGLAACIVAFAETSSAPTPVALPFMGAIAIIYGLKIYFTESSYWVSTLVYVAALFTVLYVLGALS